MTGAGRLTWTVAVATACVACTSSRPAPCPGDPIATIPLRADLLLNEGGCAFVSGDDHDADSHAKLVAKAAAAGAKSFDLTATVATETDGTALLCPSRPEASPLRGTLVSDRLVVTGPTVAANVPATVCACSVQVSEALDGTLVRGENGSVTFSGTLRNALSVTDGVDAATCEPASTPGQAGSRCGAPCELRWTVSGSR